MIQERTIRVVKGHVVTISASSRLGEETATHYVDDKKKALGFQSY